MDGSSARVLKIVAKDCLLMRLNFSVLIAVVATAVAKLNYALSEYLQES
jgi:hypothetical protein